jgi:hypothetical protein
LHAIFRVVVFADEGAEWLDFMDGAIAARLSPDELRLWRSARARAEADGTFFMTFPHHCAIGTKA